MPTVPMDDPLTWFETWLASAKASSEREPTAMSLATVDDRGQPMVRIVLLKGVDRKGFVFYTNLGSRKGRQLRGQPRAGLCWLWKEEGRQVRVEGPVKPLADEEADAYFSTRPRGSQIGAWASRQSKALESREALEARVQEVKARFEGRAVERPPHWSGYRVVPTRVEFWEIGDHRLHDRWEFERQGPGWNWQRRRLFP